MNLVEDSAEPHSVRAELVEALRQAQGERVQGAALTLGIRASALRVLQRPGDVALPGQVELAEISGSDTFVHVSTAIGELVAQLQGVHRFDLGAALTLYLDPRQAYVFDARGDLLVAPGGHR
jgi:glycerol transport system ATP-binding protein